MKSIIRYCFISCLSVILLACADDLLISGQMPHLSTGDGIDITLSFPDMPTTATRALGESAPKLNDLDIFLFVFDGNNLLQTIHIPKSDTSWSDEAANRVKFTAHLPQTDDNATIHIIATDDADGKFSQQINRVGYGLEDIVMPAFIVSGDKDVYWQRVELGCRILVSVDHTDDPTLDNVVGTETEVRAKFSNPIPLIRNFAKVTLTSSVSENIFKVVGWTIVNDLDASSVVPWFSKPNSSDVEFPQYADFSKTPADIFGYNAITRQGYQGVSPAEAKKRHTLDKLGAGSQWGTNERYIYERQNVSVEPLYVLLYGTFRNPTSGATKSGYYKLALGYRDPLTGLFSEYNVLRNIQYTIRITGVSAPGYDTPNEAVSAPAFNNVSGDVTTRSMTQISDGVDMLYVNFVNYVVTQPGHEIDFRYRYLSDITGRRTERNDLVKYNDPNVGLAVGDVVQSYSEDNGGQNMPDEKDGSQWRRIKIKTNAPTDELKQQKFIVYSPPADDASGTLGLSRTINLVLRNPWDFIRMETYPGLWADDTQFPDYDPDDTPTDSDVNYYVGPEKGAQLTIFFELPAGLPEAIFPLEFTIESDRQNIENAGVGNAVVETGPSLFPGVTDSRIKYIKTVNWGDYAPDGISSTSASRIVRARFVTTTAISSLDFLEDGANITTVKLYNPYFNEITDKFKRDASKNVDTPAP
ncbi:MAG: hypothetical protein J1F25_07680 [Prevotellaceae bacterium]|nr:hypothetical protein [Prevotellaceae bacterium]